MSAADIEKLLVAKTSNGSFFPFFTIGELSKMTKSNASNVRKDVKKLVDCGMLKPHPFPKAIGRESFQLSKEYYKKNIAMK